VSGGRKCPVARAAAAAAVEDFGRRLLASSDNDELASLVEVRLGRSGVNTSSRLGGTNCEPTLRLPD